MPAFHSFVRHLEEVDLRNRARDVQQGVDSPKLFECGADNTLWRFDAAQVQRKTQRFCPGFFDRIRNLFERLRISRNQYDGSEVAR